MTMTADREMTERLGEIAVYESKRIVAMKDRVPELADHVLEVQFMAGVAVALAVAARQPEAVLRILAQMDRNNDSHFEEDARNPREGAHLMMARLSEYILTGNTQGGRP